LVPLPYLLNLFFHGVVAVAIIFMDSKVLFCR
jgi:hypothetical protein